MIKDDFIFFLGWDVKRGSLTYTSQTTPYHITFEELLPFPSSVTS